MRYKSFRIRNFKGIKDTTVNLSSSHNAAIFAFVGLNESGKTTVLEAIHSFSPDRATSELVGGEDSTGVPAEERVPRHLISTFTGDVSVSATVELTADDKKAIVAAVLDDNKLKVDIETFPSEVKFERQNSFKDGDLQSSAFKLLTEIKVRAQGERNCVP
jgi:predicted ATP-dependent endonuclease of OLD family